jgi:hypothetical protein
MPDSAERVFIVEDGTNRSSSQYTLTVKTVSGTGLTLPVGSTTVLYSDGTNITGKLQTKGYHTPGGTYTTVNGDQVLVDTSGSGISAAVTVGRNGSNINGSGSDLVVSTNASAFTLVYVNAARGWVYKDKI